RTNFAIHESLLIIFGISQVTVALRDAGLETSNLILGIDFTKSNEWTGKHSFTGRNLHAIGTRPNPYQQAISIIGRTLAAFDEDNLIPCFGFGDVSTHDDSVFSFLPNQRYCNGFEEVLERYREIVPNLKLAGPTSFAPIIDASVDIVERSNWQYHVLVIIADGQVTRSSDIPAGRLSRQEQATVNSIVAASRFPLSIILIGVGDGPWDTMQHFDDNIPDRAFDNFQFVNFTKIMSENNNVGKKEAAFALSALMEIPLQYKFTKNISTVEKKEEHLSMGNTESMDDMDDRPCDVNTHQQPSFQAQSSMDTHHRHDPRPSDMDPRNRNKHQQQRIDDNYSSLDQVISALRDAGLESSNLILGIDFTKSNEWTGKYSFNRRSLHAIGSTPNPYEQAISIIGRTLSPFDEDNLIPCFGFGDASTHDKFVFRFFAENRYCHGFEEVLFRYREIVPHLKLSGPTSFAPVIDAAIDIVEKSSGQYHVLVIIADGQVTRNPDTPPGRVSHQEQATINSIVAASHYPLSIILVGVGDGPWDAMHQFDDNIPYRAFDNFQVCPICLTNPKDMAFGCGHLTCKECSITVSTCPICREPITTRLRLYS
ncbi:hypothetical protein IFM89_001724, partial [Coptis chinensis]